MKKLFIILITVILNIFLFSCSSDDVIEAQDSQHVEIQTPTGGEDGQTPADDDEEDEN